MPVISDDYAAEIVTKLRADHESRDLVTGGEPPDPRDLLLLKMYDDLAALQKAMSFLGGGIKPVTRANG